MQTKNKRAYINSKYFYKLGLQIVTFKKDFMSITWMIYLTRKFPRPRFSKEHKNALFACKIF